MSASEVARTAAALRACHRLRTVPARVVDEVAAASTLRRLAAGQTVFRVGDRSRAMYVVEGGRIVSRVRSAEGHVLDVGSAGPGDLFGYFEVFVAGARDCDAVAVQPSTVVEVPPATAVRLLSSGPAALVEVIGDLVRIVKQQNRTVSDHHFQTVPVRLAGLLLELAGPDGRVELTGPQALLAQQLGTTRQTLSTTLHGFAADGLLAVQPGGRVVTLLDRQGLRRLAPRS